MKDIRRWDDRIQILVEWIGLPDEVDQTWEPLEMVLEDLPGFLEDVLGTAGNHKLKNEAKQLCKSDEATIRFNVVPS